MKGLAVRHIVIQLMVWFQFPIAISVSTAVVPFPYTHPVPSSSLFVSEAPAGG